MADTWVDIPKDEWESIPIPQEDTIVGLRGDLVPERLIEAGRQRQGTMNQALGLLTAGPIGGPVASGVGRLISAAMESRLGRAVQAGLEALPGVGPTGRAVIKAYRAEPEVTPYAGVNMPPPSRGITFRTGGTTTPQRSFVQPQTVEEAVATPYTGINMPPSRGSNFRMGGTTTPQRSFPQQTGRINTATAAGPVGPRILSPIEAARQAQLDALAKAEAARRGAYYPAGMRDLLP